jgi:putative component of toxin-antitoxin plasmid stabilization module
MLPLRVLELRYYLTAGGESPFESWFSDLDAAAAAKVSVALVRLGQGNTSNAKTVGEGVLEYRIAGDLAIGCISGATAKRW